MRKREKEREKLGERVGKEWKKWGEREGRQGKDGGIEGGTEGICSRGEFKKKRGGEEGRGSIL
jgi:hypothetical protein